MTSKIQIIILTISFLYGFIFYYLFKLNSKIINNQKIIYRSLTTMLFMFNIVLLYIIIIYKINNGSFHLYFLLMIILGFIININFTKKLQKNGKFRQLVAKLKQICYTLNSKRGDKNEKESN